LSLMWPSAQAWGDAGGVVMVIFAIVD